ncbi:hypothetical protein [Nonomuraea sp. NPDC052265]|uniref:hypothetical protein n=1 Tax=Nonomuraea sp. NPDC052265 TaxID=3364374 RepID=UPI0037CC79D3
MTSSNRRSEDELKVPSQRSDDERKDDEHRDPADETGDRYDDTRGRHDGGYPNDTGHTQVIHGYASTVPDRDHDDEPPYKDPYASTGAADGDLPGEPERDTPLGRGTDHRSPDPAHADAPADVTSGYETPRDVLSGTEARHGERSDDVLVHDDRPQDEPAHGGRAQEDVLVHSERADDDLARDDLARDDLARDDLARDDLTPAGVAHDGVARDGLTDRDLSDRDLTDGSLPEGGRPAEKAPLEKAPVEGLPVEGTPVEGAPVEETPVAGAPVDDVPSHAAPQEIALFDQDPADVQARWRDVQASFVDDPADAIQRADGLVGEVVESLTNSLTSRTGALRDRWKDVDSPDTEDLRQAFRDYRNVLERLLALSTHNLSTETRR